MQSYGKSGERFMLNTLHTLQRLGAICAVACTFGYAIPATGTDSGHVNIRFSGARNWSANCNFLKDSGKEREIARRGRGNQSIKVLEIRDITSGRCTLNVPAGTQLKVTFTGTGAIACPFKITAPCMRIFTAGDEQTFGF